MLRKTIYILSLLMISSWSIGQTQPGQKKALNIIIMIGDGMGLSHLSAPFYYGDQEPVFTNFQHIGLVRTSSATHKVTDSGAAATAMFTGHKTYNNAIGMNIDTLAEQNLAEAFSKLGYMTGVISTSSLTDATPGGFYAHQAERTMHREIANDLIYSDIDFFAGGGLLNFISTTGEDLFKTNNIEVEFSKLKKIRNPEPGRRYGFLLALDGMPPVLNGRKDFLSKATDISLDYLSSNENGFILMIEGSQIDWAAHTNHVDYLISEMTDFEKAVRKAYDFAEKDGNTLLIVTADHETGGFALGASGENGYNADYAVITPSFASTNHSASLVPLLAFGPGAETFTGFFENTDIFYKILDLVK